jgi:threonine dehydratase
MTEVAALTKSEIDAALSRLVPHLARRPVGELRGAGIEAALLGPLRERVRGRKVGIIVCGANIDYQSYLRLLN